MDNGRPSACSLGHNRSARRCASSSRRSSHATRAPSSATARSSRSRAMRKPSARSASTRPVHGPSLCRGPGDPHARACTRSSFAISMQLRCPTTTACSSRCVGTTISVVRTTSIKRRMMVITEDTIHKLVSMKLHTMAKVLRELLEAPPTHELSFEEKLGMLVDREWLDRDNRRLARRIKDAKLPLNASLEDVVCDPGRGLEKTTVRTLATCAWVRAKQNAIVVGATGVGKTFIGAALAQAACRQGFRALCTRVPRLVHDLALARADGTYRNELQRLAR